MLQQKDIPGKFSPIQPLQDGEARDDYVSVALRSSASAFHTTQVTNCVERRI